MRLAILKVKSDERVDSAKYQLGVVPCTITIRREERTYVVNGETQSIDDVVVFSGGVSHVLDMSFEDAVREVDEALADTETSHRWQLIGA